MFYSCKFDENFDNRSIEKKIFSRTPHQKGFMHRWEFSFFMLVPQPSRSSYERPLFSKTIPFLNAMNKGCETSRDSWVWGVCIKVISTTNPQNCSRKLIMYVYGKIELFVTCPRNCILDTLKAALFKTWL